VRNAAVIEWVKETFAEAKAKHASAIMFYSQADPAFDNTGAQGEPRLDPDTLA
jgi:hypothetical protein